MEMAYYLTDIGKLRRQNEDSAFVYEGEEFSVAIVADGMGGHLAGEVASEMAVDIISKALVKIKPKLWTDFEDKLRDAFVLANGKIYDYAEKNSKLLGMGTTAVTAIATKDKLYVANVGDSRAYIIRDNTIKQISVDHSYVWQLVLKGEITEQQARRHPKRNYITRAMGTEENVVVDTFTEDFKDGIVLLCSDGLTNLVESYEIRDIIEHSRKLKTAAEKLVSLANERGGNDNITVALLKAKSISKKSKSEGIKEHE